MSGYHLGVFMNRLTFLALTFPLAAVGAVTLTPSVQPPATLGTVVTFRANLNGGGSSGYSFRFRVRRPLPILRARHVTGLGYRTVVDYGPNASLDWTTIEREGAYEIEVSARNNMTGDVSADSILCDFSRLATDRPVVTPTRHPLVFVYSAPPCADGARMRVRFFAADGLTQNTPLQDCDERTSMNFYLAGLRAGTQYTAWQTIDNSGVYLEGPAVNFTTGIVTITAPPSAPLVTPLPNTAGILLQSVINSRPIATDLSGNLLWYGPSDLSLVTRLTAGGTILGVREDGTRDPSAQIFREFDLAGVTIAETNAGQINQQLAALGARPITSFHHEAIHLPDGRYLILAGSEQIME